MPQTSQRPLALNLCWWPSPDPPKDSGVNLIGHTRGGGIRGSSPPIEICEASLMEVKSIHGTAPWVLDSFLRRGGRSNGGHRHFPAHSKTGRDCPWLERPGCGGDQKAGAARPLAQGAPNLVLGKSFRVPAPSVGGSAFSHRHANGYDGWDRLCLGCDWQPGRCQARIKEKRWELPMQVWYWSRVTVTTNMPVDTLPQHDRIRAPQLSLSPNL
jgi:hypothetical protein